jgi:pimeloyl-ACP methyl ester carboxylesterase
MLVVSAQSLAQAQTRELSFVSDSVRFSATLHLPSGGGPFPAVVLVHPSGRGTRDQWPLVQHAQSFAKSGIATLVYDKRGTGQSGGTFERFPDLRQLTRDALAAVRALKAVPEIDQGRIGIWGRSQGAGLASVAAADDRAIAFVVFVAGVAVLPIEQELYAQRPWLIRAGATVDQVAILEPLVRTIWTYYATAKDRSGAQEAWATLSALPWFSSVRGAIGGLPRASVIEPEQWVLDHATRELRWQSGLLNDPAVVWSRITVPVLGIFGGEDVVVPGAASAAALLRALQAAGNTRGTTMFIADGAHSLCPAHPPEKLVDDCEFARGYLEMTASWILAQPPRAN